MPFLRAAPQLASPLLETARRKVTPTANWAPWYGGSPEASTFAHRSPSALTATFLSCASSLASPRRSHRCLLSSGCGRGCERVCDHCVHAKFFVKKKTACESSDPRRTSPKCTLTWHSAENDARNCARTEGMTCTQKMRPRKKNQRTPQQPNVVL